MSNDTGSGGISAGGALTLIFVVLKLTDHIYWSWWWVLSPVWGTLVLFCLLILGVMTYEGFSGWVRRRRHMKALQLEMALEDEE